MSLCSPHLGRAREPLSLSGAGIGREQRRAERLESGSRSFCTCRQRLVCAGTQLSYLSAREPGGAVYKTKQRQLLEEGVCWVLRDMAL